MQRLIEASDPSDKTCMMLDRYDEREVSRACQVLRLCRVLQVFWRTIDQNQRSVSMKRN